MKQGNTKLGKLIWQWSLIAGLAAICIGATSACLEVCYAMRSHYRYKTVQDSLYKNYELSLTDFFVGFILGCLFLFKIRIARIHASGDFYSPEYVGKWTEIAQRRPDVTFYAYTRSWRNRDGSLNEPMLQAFTTLAALPNVRLWYSCDKNTGEPPLTSHVMRCYLQGNDEDIPNYDVDLFFRNSRKSIVKRVKGKIVCPVENGATSTTCSACKLCYTPVLLHRINAKVVKSNSDIGSSGLTDSVFSSDRKYKQKFKQEETENENCISDKQLSRKSPKPKSRRKYGKPKSAKSRRPRLFAGR